MLSNRNITTINNQIAEELRKAGRYTIPDSEKMAALDRVAKLKTLLSEQTPQSIDYDQLATALIEQMAPRPTREVHPFLAVLEALARRS